MNSYRFYSDYNASYLIWHKFDGIWHCYGSAEGVNALDAILRVARSSGSTHIIATLSNFDIDDSNVNELKRAEIISFESEAVNA